MIAATLQSPHDPMPDTPQPLELRLQPQALAISWSDGRMQILGARVLRLVAADACIDGTAVALLHAVRSGQSVTAISRFAGGEVSAMVVASEHGDPGRVIQVVNPQTRRALKARVLSAGVVEILP